ncbi:putative transporter-like protein [Cladobotryum mycophilum]|uniref:Transporter-like protein n=1 Tax=Cladobotryum mycophilum TaxID=491253 RepID=A0ABR0SMU8_9HYPO
MAVDDVAIPASSSSYEPEKDAALASNDVSVSVSSRMPAIDSMAQFREKLCWKLDVHLLTPMFFLNFLSLMGRTNIGAALVQGLPHDLHLDAIKVFLAITMPLVMLILFEVPSNLLMKWLEVKMNLSYMRYLSLITVGLGVVTLGQAFDKTYGALLGTRFVVGIFDAGLIPGCVFVLSLYYPSIHMQWRMSMLMVANIVSNIVSNILAFAIAEIKDHNGWHGWRWIFLVEGCLTITIGLICCYSDVGRPEKSTFLTQEEKDVIANIVESRVSTIGLVAEWKTFFGNVLNYVWASLYVLTCSTTYSVAIFAPSFVKAFHPEMTTPQIQGQVVPIFVVSAVACLLVAWLADRTNHRSGFAIIGYIFTIIGYAILRFPKEFGSSVLMLGLYFISIGTFSSLPMVWTLTSLNLATPTQKAIGSGFVIGVGNVGGFVSAWIFRTSEGPYYSAGMTDALILTCVAAGLTAVTWTYIEWHNKRLGSASDRIDILSSGVVFRYRS